MAVFPEVLFGVGALAVAAALIWALAFNARRNRRNDAITAEATRASYEHPETYQQTREWLEKKLEG